ncbi:MAG: FAD-binding oxidoreductase [Roseitalea sp.]|jgi:FAD/FMN-containing dehydrogenase|uniref:FAD-binding oxidoreductase n=1 Tax=Oceaniradius stylonematis TaxID=2184161 RepID=A0A3A8A694_9HYPH|nr:FAD-binding oxidoreductase [Oceaniradius stylonematis]MBO6551413.1 FAD-binding oxidoreductase [Roseitalea sp.]MBO6952207.1 FAD-binding oxidoreductase [Rhizobiaceae bacterium]RNC90755.1 MAG: FAD-binding oxidoreductase [Oricola sp.]MBO6591947.1 FAD-binding oxidoreductase [Roseitalea sp.]MBO6598202.1 FAD-binding oxidoreductase [Roseitalea sp.]
MRSVYDGFGRVRPARRAAVAGPLTAEALRDAAPGSLLPYGNGRSYGDTCHNDAGTLADMRGSARIVAFNPDSGVLEAEAGVMLHRIIDYCASYGFFLPVTPGTRFVTLGGAVANDVHGKNHHVRGTLGRHVEQIELVRSDGTHTLSRTANPALFAATIGGMGLTGIITRVRLKMMKVGSLNLIERLQPFATLDAYFDEADAADAANEYAVAWLDQLNGERGVLMTANHADDGDYRTAVHAPRLSVPFELPLSALNHFSLRAFNAAFHFAKARKAGRDRVTGFAGFFYPLDAVGNWNRLYGPAGLFQHQSAIPFETARAAIPAMLAASRRAGQASFLTVLKRFGDIASPGVMSFPVPGYTLTLDFPNRGPKTLALLDELDRITVEAGGRVNPYKDARMGAETFAACFPHWHQLEALRDPALCSDFWRRTALMLSKNGNGSIATDDLQQTLTKVS